VISQNYRFGQINTSNSLHHPHRLVAKISDKQHQVNTQLLECDRVLGFPLIVNITNDGNCNRWLIMTGHIHSFLIIPVSSIKKSRTRWLKSKNHLRACRGDPMTK